MKEVNLFLMGLLYNHLLCSKQVNGRRSQEVSQAWLNNNLSTVLDVTVTTDAKEVGTNPAGDTSKMLVVSKERTLTATLPAKDVADSTEDKLSQLAVDTMIPAQEVRAT